MSPRDLAQAVDTAEVDTAPAPDVDMSGTDAAPAPDLDLAALPDLHKADAVASPDMKSAPDMTAPPDLLPALSPPLGPCAVSSECDGWPPPELTDSNWLTRHPPLCVRPTYISSGVPLCAVVNYFQKPQSPPLQPKTCARLELPAPWYMGSNIISSTEFCPPSNSQPIDIRTLVGSTVTFSGDIAYSFEVQAN